jgi:hypothetical protein
MGYNSGLDYFVRAAIDLSDTNVSTGVLYKAVNVESGNIAETSLAATGIILEAANTGNSVTYRYQGVSKYAATGTITAGSDLTVTTSGYFTTAASGDYSVGKATVDATSGSIGVGIFNFVTPSNLIA